MFRAGIPGEWQFRLWAHPELPLPTTPGVRAPATLGQTHYAEQWFRLRPWLSVGERFSAHAVVDLTRAILAGDSTRQVEFSIDNRSNKLSPFSHGIADLRALHVEWRSPLGVLRAGHQQSHWGLGIVANDGDHAPVFGDYRNGDIVERVAFATRPGGARSPWVVALSGDLVFRDRLASLLSYQVPIELGPPPFASATRSEQPETRTLGGDVAWQGILAAFHQDPACERECERKRVGMYAVYRTQTNRLGDALSAGFADVAARWEWPTPDGLARVFAAGELAFAGGYTTLARSASRPEGHWVLQHGGAVQLGIEKRDAFRVVIEGGYASGDANPADDTLRRFTFNPAHRVGLLLFPEVLAWHTARSASISADPRLSDRPARGAELLPSSGGVTNAAYLYPTAVVNLTRWLDVRVGGVLAVSTGDMVDPVRTTLFGTAQNYRGGDPRARDLGLELDLGLQGRHAMAGGVVLLWGAQGAGLLPGRAWDDGAGQPLAPRWLAVARIGAEY
jgi:hypothetical protein